MKAENNMIAAIKRREDVKPTYISLRKLLASGGMEHYLNLASDRIAENELIDGEETMIDFANFPDLLFTSDGLFSCRHILESYISSDDLLEAWEMLIEVERDKQAINDLAAALRKMRLSGLWQMYRETKKVDDEETAGRVCRYIRLELWSRSIFSAIWRKTKETATSAYLHMRYYRLFDIVRRCAERA